MAADTSAAQFLELTARDPVLRQRFERGTDEDLLAVAVKLGSERGLRFTKADLQAVLARQSGLEEVKLGTASDPPSNCSSRSGCRTPCLYCNKMAIDPRINVRVGPLQRVINIVRGVFRR